MTDPIVLLCRLVTFDSAQPVIDDGALYIGADELIAAAQKASDAPPAGFEDARHVQTHGAIYPDLIGDNPKTTLATNAHLLPQADQIAAERVAALIES